ncbi:general secretion pathway protein GspF [Candidatus Venteria ishoeyi]|uniref:Uncharacterized protein n=1 Tax=Candidatus Venteria ishoeyi TaxID=1899563 RepID=A0A1H6FDF1_9GAMM|nr:general secretion pathway protein GspF [Candidatus Venteria ishoeyi]MDM8545523.1 hypothetical protein [Candidatus Venteria ishoeyi]SEH07045.1 Uncharacterised protein [Candidatus Venteria ishoeyi]
MKIGKIEHKRPATVEAYIDLIEQALFEIADTREAIEFEADSMGPAIAFITNLETKVKAIKQSMIDGTYQFENKDLPFMEIVKMQTLQTLPFKRLLEDINWTHREGLQID